MDRDIRIVSREAAQAAGLKRFFTGEPCRHRHLAERFTKGGQCCACQAMYAGSVEKTKKCIICGSKFKTGGFGTGRGTHGKVTCSEACDKKREHRLRISITRRHYKKHRDERIAKAKTRKSLERAAFLFLKRLGVDVKKLLPGECTAEDIERLRKLQKNRCANPGCRKMLPDNVKQDHINPLSKGGTNEARNIQLFCSQSCNSLKGSLDPIEFAKRNGLLL